MSKIKPKKKPKTASPKIPKANSPKATPKATPKASKPSKKTIPTITSSSVELKARSVNELRSRPPQEESTNEGRYALKQHSEIAGSILGAVSIGSLFKKAMKPKPEAPPAHELSFPPVGPQVDWEKVKVGDTIPSGQKGEANWVVVQEGDRLRLERPGPEAKDGGENWTQVQERMGFGTKLERSVAADDGKGAWTETRMSEDFPGILSRQIPDPDGKGDWTESRPAGGDARSTITRQVSDPNGGNPWTEYRNPETGGVTRSRSEPHPNGGTPWHVSVNENGEEFRKREYIDENGIRWVECKSGTNHWRNNVEARQRAIAEGPNHTLSMPGPDGQNIDIQVAGATPEELERVRRHLEALPPEMRANTGVIVIASDIGQFLNDKGEITGTVGGFGGKGQITLDRASVSEDRGMSHVLYHEMGHVQDYDQYPRLLSSERPWGDGNAVSPYGNNNPAEDYAEAHRVAFQNVDIFKGLSREAILSGYPNGHRVVAILDSYKFKYGEGTEVPPIGELGSAPTNGMGGGLMGGDMMEMLRKMMEQQNAANQASGGFGHDTP